MPRSVFCRFLRCLPVPECQHCVPALQTGRWCRTLLSAGALGLGGEADPDEAVLGLELLQGLGGVVDEGEAGGLAATELGAQAEDLDLLLLGLVHGAELLAELILGDVGALGVQDVTGRGQVSLWFCGAMHCAVVVGPGWLAPIESRVSVSNDASEPTRHARDRNTPYFSQISPLTLARAALRVVVFIVVDSRWEAGQTKLSMRGRASAGGLNSHDHLLAAQQRVADELASSQGNGGVAVGHGCGSVMRCELVVGGWCCDGKTEGFLGLGPRRRKFRAPCWLTGSNPNKLRLWAFLRGGIGAGWGGAPEFLQMSRAETPEWDNFGSRPFNADD